MFKNKKKMIYENRELPVFKYHPEPLKTGAFIQGDITLLRSCYRYTGGGSIFPFTTIGTDNISGIASFKFEPKL